jgi:hypothetical protein
MSNSHFNPSLKIREKMSKSNKGKIPWIKGKHHSEETRLKMSLKKINKRPLHLFGYKHTEETKRRISKSNKGKIPWIKGKHHSEETRLKMSMSKIGKPSNMKGKKSPWTTKRNIKNNPLNNPETYKKYKKAIIAVWNTPKMKEYARNRRMKQKFPNKMTSIEIKIKNLLDKNNIIYKMHKPIMKITQPDFFIQPNICIYCDGDYWHGNIQFFPNPNKIDPPKIKYLKLSNISYISS